MVKHKYEPMLNLKMRRISKDLTQEELAVRCKISVNLISQYEVGRLFPRKKTLEALAEALECDVKDII